MKNKITALCAGARKEGSSALALRAFLGGVSSAGDFDIRTEYPFYMDFKGCRGCLGCAGKKGEKGCVQRDGAFRLLEDMRRADGVVFASPVYFWEPVPRFRALWERFLFPGPVSKHIEIAAIYTMYQPPEVARRAFTAHADALRTETVGFLGDAGYRQIVMHGLDTRPTPRPGSWEKDLERAEEAGRNFARRVLADHPKKDASAVPEDLF